MVDAMSEALKRKIRDSSHSESSLRLLFRKFDRDRSGRISSSEFRRAFADMGLRVAHHEVEKLIERLDVDGDGHINYDDFISKALATVGGFIAGDAYVIDHIKHNARSQIFSAAPPPASVGAAMKALEIVEREPERRKQLWENTDYMRRALKDLGFDTGESESPVIPVVVGDDMAAWQMTHRLEEEGVFVNPVVSPAVPEGRAMIRTSYMATHTREHLDRALEALASVGREMGILGS